MPRRAGEDVVFRHARNGQTWWAAPARVVEDNDDRVVLWWPAGTVYLRPQFTDRIDALRRLATGEWELIDTEWWGGDSLLVIPWGESYSIWPFRLDTDELVGWYCNLEAPLQRSDDGFTTNDWTLDIWAEPDLSSWKWKDEDELDAGVEVGLYSPDDVTRIRAAGDVVIELIERRDAVFDEWRDWRPPDEWRTSPPQRER